MTLLPDHGGLRRITVLMLCAMPLLFGVLALLLGQDANWDLRNYHWYNAYAVLNGRFDVDMGAAQVSAFYNPTLDLPFYAAAGAWPAKVVGFLLGAVQGCNFILLYLLAARTLRLPDPRHRVAVAAIVAFVGMIGGGHMGLLGTTFYDNVVSLFVFAAMAVVLYSADILQVGSWHQALRRAAFAGLLVGIGVGLKLPTQIFAVGICFGLLFIPGPFARRFALSFVCGLGIIAGFAVFSGWWMVEMGTRYANPLFPYFNHILQSPWGLPESYRDDRFVPKSIAQALLLPFRIALDGKTAGEIAFTDARLAIAYVVLLLTPVMLWIKRRRTLPAPSGLRPDPFAVRYLTAAAALSYGVWLVLFGIYRYAVPLEMLAPLLIVACVGLWPLGRNQKFDYTYGAFLFLALAVVAARPGSWERVPWGAGLGGRFVDVAAPVLAEPENTLILMTGFAPTSFVIPAFPPQIAFLRPHSYLVEPGHRTLFNAAMHGRIAAHTGAIFLLQASWEHWAAEEALPALGLEADFDQCRPVSNNLDKDLELCAVRRVANDAQVPQR